MEINQRTYNSNLLKGTGLVQEMLVLMQEYEPGESKGDFAKRIYEYGILSKSTEGRVLDLVNNIFSSRFLGEPLEVPLIIGQMRDEFVSMDVIIQLFYIYTCRANLILYDFVTEVYFKKVDQGSVEIRSADPKKFIEEALKTGRIEKGWAQSTIKKVSEHIIATLIDFKLIDQKKNILPFRILDLTTNYLAHELHFRGFSDNDIWNHPDWSLFGLHRDEVIPILDRLASQGTFLMQFSGELLSISWKNQNMNQFIENECR